MRLPGNRLCGACRSMQDSIEFLVHVVFLEKGA